MRPPSLLVRARGRHAYLLLLALRRYVVHGADGQIVRSRPDPPLIIAAGSVTFALAVLANLAILLRLVETHPVRPPPSPSRPRSDRSLCLQRFFSVTTCVFLSVHIAVNAVALTIFGIEHAQPDGFVLSTAFWLTAASGCVALAAVVCLLVDGLATQWYVRGGTGISGKQRSLVVAFDFFIALILVGSVAYRYLIPDVTFLDTVYLCVQSLLTVGFGGKSDPARSSSSPNLDTDPLALQTSCRVLRALKLSLIHI